MVGFHIFLYFFSSVVEYEKKLIEREVNFTALNQVLERFLTEMLI